MSLKTKYQNLLRRLETNTLEWAGLDIGSGSVKTIRGNWNDHRFTATGACLVELEDRDPQDPQKQDDLTQAIRLCLQKTGLKMPCAVCAHSGPEVVTRHFRFPPLPEEALAQAIQLEAQQMSPFDPDQSIISYQAVPVSETAAESGREGFLVVAMREAIEQKIEWVRAAGGKVLLMDVEGLAALNCLQACLSQTGDKTVGLIHIGNRFTTVSILGENGIPFIRDLTYAGKNIRAAIRQQTGLSDPEIRKALFHTGGLVPDSDALRTALKNAATRNISDINETLRYYLTQNPSGELKQLYITGGWAMSRPFVELLAGALPIRVEVFNPFQTLTIEAPPAQESLMKQSGPALAVAAGLAMRTIR